MEEHREAIDNMALDDEAAGVSTGPSPSSSFRGKPAAVTPDDRPRKRPTFTAGTPPASSSSLSSGSSAGGGGKVPPMTSHSGAGSTASKPTMPPRGSSIGSSRQLDRAPSLLLDNLLPYRSINPFDYRQEEVRLGVCALESEMVDFKQALVDTESLIRDIQMDINNARHSMANYIKDIPEAHYSAVSKGKRSKRKRAWLD